ncbi:hypothetical protein POVWA2_002990 [Plasmodium ovale wallikeri]|uniref:Uncharacterized protein n=1 Tax=Plasmodium ovale wallikeri TaxID=864142 RepID=A0A1A8YI49_PLAOA|nr:hypothetical protein POVWA2_002990 [Plasmodium ovale wallikeri]
MLLHSSQKVTSAIMLKRVLAGKSQWGEVAKSGREKRIQKKATEGSVVAGPQRDVRKKKKKKKKKLSSN